MFGATPFFCVLETACALKDFSSVFDLYPLDGGNAPPLPSYDNQRCPQAFAYIPTGVGCQIVVAWDPVVHTNNNCGAFWISHMIQTAEYPLYYLAISNKFIFFASLCLTKPHENRLFKLTGNSSIVNL